MPVFDLFSKRQKRQHTEVPNLFIYDQIPRPLRVQIVHIWNHAFGPPRVYGSPAPRTYQTIIDVLCEEYGVFRLEEGHHPVEVLSNFLLREHNIDRVLDVIELSFQAIDRVVRNDRNYGLLAGSDITADMAIEELNTRFIEHGVGYQYVSGEIVKKDSEFLHKEVTRPALSLLQDGRYKGAEDEFLRAHEHYRRGNIKECLTECLKALESTLKTICQIRGWKYQPTDTAKPLLDLCFKNGLVPEWLQTHYSGLRSALESGIPTIRNRLSGHGQGVERLEVPPHFAAYMLHLTGSTIHFLVEAERVA